MDSSKQSMDSSKQSMDSRKQSMDSSKQSMDSSKQSMDSSKQSMDSSKQSMDSSKQSMDSSKQSMDSSKQSMDSSKQSMDSSKQSMDSSKQSMDSSSEGKGRTDLGVKVENGNTLRIGDGVTIHFNRTLRIPDDNKTYPLPPSLGHFPIRRVSDYADKVPESWRKHGGVFLPMYQREAMWLQFGGRQWKPNAMKLAVGKVCALTGKPWSEELHAEPQDYLVLPAQPWLDGINSGKGTISQFIAMPLGLGYTVEGQVTGEEKHGGLQICVFEPKAGVFPDHPPPPPVRVPRSSSYKLSGGSSNHKLYGGSSNHKLYGGSSKVLYGSGCKAKYEADGAHMFTPPKLCSIEVSKIRVGGTFDSAASTLEAITGSPKVQAGGMEMGLGAGGSMRQEIYTDTHGLKVWDQSTYARVFVHLCNSAMWRDITGEAPPESPVSAKTYAAHGLPWFDLYDEGREGVDTSPTLAAVKTVKEMDQAKGFGPQQDDSSVHFPSWKVHTSLPPAFAKKLCVDDGEW